ncbi:unnamed protein product [Diplocarpon coronariae]|uniref:Uncharacterized protein n=1 Tax=Diplocarpon coronariae TaxID=2795749 RepID=A0A218Z6R1_9HELO|nr:hypothetical protein B2J93_2200 [Marssonina coronariae]
MASSPRAAMCQYSRALVLSSALLLLSTILPNASLAQLTDPALSIPPPDSEPTTLQTSPSPVVSSSPSQTRSPPPVISNPSAADGNRQNNIFNYYFIIVAVVVLLFLLGAMYIAKQWKKRAATMRSGSQAALARDVEGLRARLGVAMAAGRTRHERTEGLDEEGEAPPPYHAGSKPPSLRSADGVGVREVGSRAGEAPEQVALRNIAMQRPDPPGYHEATARVGTGGNEGSSEEDLDMARPAPVATATPQRNLSKRT